MPTKTLYICDNCSKAKFIENTDHDWGFIGQEMRPVKCPDCDWSDLKDNPRVGTALTGEEDES